MLVLNRNEGGFTLTEAILAMVILGVASVILVLPFSTGAAIQAEGVNRTIGANLASELMEKVISTSFEQIVTSFDGYSEPEGGLKDFQGQLYNSSNYEHFSRDVSCNYVYVPQESGDKEANFILITVNVYYQGGQIAAIHKLISK
ncbi:MAG: type IV pilus modification PilV family protein [Planctomycetota bacterium]|jgi:prepilin-type N-terminal cleavage/methylation domain-containing protein